MRLDIVVYLHISLIKHESEHQPNMDVHQCCGGGEFGRSTQRLANFMSNFFHSLNVGAFVCQLSIAD